MGDPVGIVTATLPSGLLLAAVTLALGASFRLMRFPDLTVEGSFLIGGSVWTACQMAGLHTSASSLLGLLAGAFCGSLTAFLSRALGVDRFLAGILVASACYSLALIVLQTSNMGLYNLQDVFFQGFDLSGSPVGFAMCLVAISSAVFFLFFKRRLGVRARFAAINPDFLDGVAGKSLIYLVIGLALTNAAAAASGMAFARFQGFVDVGMGAGILIVALASFAIGETVVGRLPINLVSQTILAAAIGSVLYQIALGFALALGVPAALTKLVSAVLVLIFLVLNTRREKAPENQL